MKAFCMALLFIARCCISVIFLFSAISKFMNPDVFIAFVQAKGLSSAHFFVTASGVLEIIGSVSLILGLKARWGALLLLLYLVPVSVIMHNFWDLTGADRMMAQIEFFKNLAIFGGLLYVIGFGTGHKVCHQPASEAKP